MDAEGLGITITFSDFTSKLLLWAIELQFSLFVYITLLAFFILFSLYLVKALPTKHFVLIMIFL